MKKYKDFDEGVEFSLRFFKAQKEENYKRTKTELIR